MPAHPPDDLETDREWRLWRDLSRLYEDYCGDEEIEWPERKLEFKRIVDRMFAPAWQPIGTAPKDGTEILLAHSNSQWIDWWTNVNELGGFWCMCDQWETPEVPSHWKPLTALPEVNEPAQEMGIQTVG